VPPKRWPKVPPTKLERANVELLNLEFMNAEFNPLWPNPAFANAELPCIPFPIRVLVDADVPSRAPVGVDARDGETAEALPRGLVAAALAVALWFAPALRLGACELAAAFPCGPKECQPGAVLAACAPDAGDAAPPARAMLLPPPRRPKYGEAAPVLPPLIRFPADGAAEPRPYPPILPYELPPLPYGLPPILLYEFPPIRGAIPCPPP